NMSGPDTGMGFKVHDGESFFSLTALDTQIVRSWGLLKDPTQSGWQGGFAAPTDPDGNLVTSDHRSLRLVRLVCHRRYDKVQAFVEDMNTPLISASIADVAQPSQEVEGRIEVGMVAESTVEGEAHLAAISYLTSYDSWEVSEEAYP